MKKPITIEEARENMKVYYNDLFISVSMTMSGETLYSRYGYTFKSKEEAVTILLKELVEHYNNNL